MSSAHQRILGRTYHASLFTRFEFSRQEWESSEDPSRTDLYYVRSTLFHEWVHRVSLVSTSMGHELIDLTLNAGMQIGKTFRRYIEDKGVSRLRRPLLVNLMLDKQLREHFDEGTRLGMGAGAIARKHLGGSGDVPGISGELPKGFMRGVRPPLSTYCPLLQFYGNEIHLGAWHILEALAAINEKLYIGLQYGMDTLDSAIKCFPKDPYEIVEALCTERLGSEGGNVWLVRAICDLAMDGSRHPDFPERSVAWEDLHPGWRLIKVLEFLAENRKLYLEVGLDTAGELRENIRNGLEWWDPWVNGSGQGGVFAPYVSPFCEVRESRPAAPAMCYEYFVELVEIVPFNPGFPSAPADQSNWDWLSNVVDAQGGHRHEAITRVAMAAESVNDLVFNPVPECPIHGIKFQTTGCIDGCEYSSWMKAITGLSSHDIASTELAADCDLSFLEE